MIGKQKEELIVSLAEKGESYRTIAKEACVSPNTIKAVLNRAGLDETTSISSRAFELFSKENNPLQVAITLNLKAEEAIRYHCEYFLLLGCTEFAKIYHQIDNPWPYVNLVTLAQNGGMSDDKVLELFKIANGSLPRIILEYDRVRTELNSLEARKLNSVNEYQRQRIEISNLHKEKGCLQLIIGKLQQDEEALNQQKERTRNLER